MTKIKIPYSNTTIPPERTKADIEKLLREHGIEDIQWTTYQGDTKFTSDTFRTYGLSDDMQDPQHEVGMRFAKWKWHRLILPVRRVRSKIESNHKRMITVFKFKTPEVEPQ